jgi:D-glycero-D-manno-heptose 1,7-bisphosphate phosphatase
MRYDNLKLIILDRDGVINEDSDQYIKSPNEWHAISGSLEAIVKLNNAGYKVVVATNQSGIARNFFTEDILLAIHKKMQNELAKIGGHIDDIFYCPHHPNDNCMCRKPNPKMLLDIFNKYNFNANECLLIGDSLKDIQVAKKVGCEVILVKTGKGNKTLMEYPSEIRNTSIFENLAEAVNYILD